VSSQGLEPVTEFTEPFFEFDFPAMRIGVAEYAEGPTGTTVFWFPEGVRAVVDVRGGWFEVEIEATGEVTGLVLQPGPWSVPARRLPK
jgi:hypothetical protein